VVFTITGGEVIGHRGGAAGPAVLARDSNALRFVRISDGHLGFHGPVNTEVGGLFVRAVNQVNALGCRPDFVMHTGDLTYLSAPDQFDQVRGGQVMRGVGTGGVFTVPGGHDSIDDRGQAHPESSLPRRLLRRIGTQLSLPGRYVVMMHVITGTAEGVFDGLAIGAAKSAQRRQGRAKLLQSLCSVEMSLLRWSRCMSGYQLNWWVQCYPSL